MKKEEMKTGRKNGTEWKKRRWADGARKRGGEGAKRKERDKVWDRVKKRRRRK